MLRHSEPQPLDARVEADRPITAELLAVVAGQPLQLAIDYRRAWFGAARTIVDSGAVLVFDELVMGPPCPLLLEAVHHVREMRRAEHLGRFDDEEERWYEQHVDDDEAVWHASTITDRVLAVLASGQEGERLVAGAAVARIVSRSLDRDLERWLSFAQFGLSMDRLLVELADGIRIGDAAVVDARLPGERADGWRWAA